MATTKQKGGYVDGFVLVVPKKKVAAYKKMAREAAVVWKKYGALDYKECKGDDLKAKGTPAPVSFLTLAHADPDETVWFSFVMYKNKKHRNEVNKKVIAYFSEKYADPNTPMPFDMARMAYGGFSVEVD